MKFLFYSSFFILLLTSCNNTTWWSDRLISKIECDNGVIELFDYDNNNQLIHYKKYIPIWPSSPDQSEIYYDVDIEYLGDTVVKVKGIIPYKDVEKESVYNTYSEIIYKLNKQGLAKSAITYCHDSIIDKDFPPKSRFEYKNKQLSHVVLPFESKAIYYNDNNITYDTGSESYSSGFIMTPTFINYEKEKNKSCLLGALDEYIGYHIPAYYARILGNPSKNLISRNAFLTSGLQLILDYDYELDKDGYVSEMTINQSSNVLVFYNDPMSKSSNYKISYK